MNAIPLRFLSDDTIRPGGGGGQKVHALTLNVLLADFFLIEANATKLSYVS